MTATATEQDVAGRVLDLVKATGGGVEAEVLVERQELALTRFANSYVHQNVADATTAVRLRVHAEGRTASTSTTVLGGLDDLVERTLAALRLAPADPSWPGLTPPTPSPLAGHRGRGHRPGRPGRAGRPRTSVRRRGRWPGDGRLLQYLDHDGRVRELGRPGRARRDSTQAAMDAIARTPTSDGVTRLASVRLADLDGTVLGARAAAKALAGADPVELPPGRYEVVLEPTAVADVLQILALYGFNAKAVAERRSFVELGAAQFDRSVTIVDDLTEPSAIGHPVRRRGHPAPVAQAGRRRRFGGRRARPPYRRESRRPVDRSCDRRRWRLGRRPGRLRLLPGSGPAPSEVDGPAADSAVAALVAGVERGLLVTDNHYTRVLDPRTLVVTGLTRNGVWLIERR